MKIPILHIDGIHVSALEDAVHGETLLIDIVRLRKCDSCEDHNREGRQNGCERLLETRFRATKCAESDRMFTTGVADGRMALNFRFKTGGENERMELSKASVVF